MESNLVQNLVNLKSLPETWAVKDFKEVVSDNSGGNKKLAKSNFLNEGEIAVVDQGKKLIAGYYNNTSLAVKTQPPYVVFGDHTRAFKYVDFPFIMGADGTKVLQPKKENCDTKYLYYFFLSINVPNTGYNRHFKYLKKLKIPLPPLDQQKKIATILDAADAYRQKTKALIEKYDELTQSLFLDMFGDPVRNPKGWKKVPLKDVIVKIGRGKSPKYSEYETGFWAINQKCIQWGVINPIHKKPILESFFLDLKNEFKAKKDDVLVNSTGTGTLGRSSVYNLETDDMIDSHVTIVRPILGDVKSIFLSVFFNQKNIQSEIYRTSVTGSTNQIELNKESFSKFQIYLPDLSIQNQFADSVQAIEAQKAQAQASLAQAEDLFNSLLQRAFKGELV